MNQREEYVEGCVKLRVKLKNGEITEEEYEILLIKLGRQCQEYLLGPIDELVGMFQEIKEKSGLILDGLGDLQ